MASLKQYVVLTLQWFKQEKTSELDEYWHGPVGLLRIKLEEVPAEVPHYTVRVVCKHDVMSNWKFPWAGGLRRYLSSVKHRKNLRCLLCDCPEFHPVSTCEHSAPPTKLYIRSQTKIYII